MNEKITYGRVTIQIEHVIKYAVAMLAMKTIKMGKAVGEQETTLKTNQHQRAKANR